MNAVTSSSPRLLSRSRGSFRFDYSVLPDDVARLARDDVAVVHCSLRRSAEEVIAAGLALLRQKAALGHGHFGTWLEAEVGLDATEAGHIMNVARVYGDAENSGRVQNLSSAALYELCAPRTSIEVRAEAERLIAAGATVTKPVIKRLQRAARADADGEVRVVAATHEPLAPPPPGAAPDAPAPAAAEAEEANPFGRVLGDDDAGRAMLELFDLARYSGSSSALLAAAGTDAARRKRLIDAAKKVRGLADDLIQEAAR